jgi:hypothetical protein
MGCSLSRDTQKPIFIVLAIVPLPRSIEIRLCTAVGDMFFFFVQPM